MEIGSHNDVWQRNQRIHEKGITPDLSWPWSSRAQAGPGIEALTFLHVQIQRKNYPLSVQMPKLRIVFCTMIDGKEIKESMRNALHLI